MTFCCLINLIDHFVMNNTWKNNIFINENIKIKSKKNYYIKNIILNINLIKKIKNK